MRRLFRIRQHNALCIHRKTECTHWARTYPSLSASQNILLSLSSPPPLMVPPPTVLDPHIRSTLTRGASLLSTSSHGSVLAPAGAPARPPYGEVVLEARRTAGGGLAISFTMKVEATRRASRCGDNVDPVIEDVDMFRE